MAMVAKNATEQKPSNDLIVKTDWGLSNSWDDAISVLIADGGVIQSADAFGDGSILLDKKELLGVEFIVLEFRFIMDEKTNREYVNVLVMNRSGNKARFNDGSTGVYQQCIEYRQKYQRQGGIHCPKGLRVSEYLHENAKGEKSEAQTYYFA